MIRSYRYLRLAATFHRYRCASTVSRAFLLAVSKTALTSSALSINNLAASRSRLTDTYAAEACLGVSNVPIRRFLYPQFLYPQLILAWNVPDDVFWTPRGRPRSSGTNLFFGMIPPTASTAFFWASSNIATTWSAPHEDSLALSISFRTVVYAVEACSRVSNVPIWRNLPSQYILDWNLPVGF